MLPRRQEPAEGGGPDGFDLLSCRSERPSAQPPQYLGVAPLRARRAGAELSCADPFLGSQPMQHVLHHRGAESESGRRLRRGERAVGAGVPADQIAQRIGHRLDERRRHADRQRDPESVPET